MGRTAYSLAYAAPVPAIRTEPEPKVDICERWSAWNRFDPDSEDFFQDAEYEAFVDPVQAAREQAENEALAAAEGSSDTSESTESAISDQGSPMAVGSDDPAVLIADAYSNHNPSWDESEGIEVVSPTGITWNPASLDSNTHEFDAFTEPLFPPSSPTSDQSDIPAFIPPASFRAPSPGIERMSDEPNDTPRPVFNRRTVPITPITVLAATVDSGARSPSPSSPDPPSTPPSALYYPRGTMLSPSPPPSVTPRFYSWQHHAIPSIPTSPTLVRGSRDGPLTNPRARMSLARIDTPHVPVRITSIVM